MCIIIQGKKEKRYFYCFSIVNHMLTCVIYLPKKRQRIKTIFYYKQTTMVMFFILLLYIYNTFHYRNHNSSIKLHGKVQNMVKCSFSFTSKS